MESIQPDTDVVTVDDDPIDLDLAVVLGTLSSDPVAHQLPSGSTLMRYEVTVRDRSPADTVPVTWLDPSRAPTLRQGDRVLAVGRVRRRFFRAGGFTRSSTEVAATSVRRPSSARDAQAALADAQAALGSVS